MASQQTSVAAAAIAIAGQLADNGFKFVESRISTEASAEIPFGTMVTWGTSKDTDALKLNTSAAAMVGKLAGVVVFEQAYAKDTELGTTGLKPGATLNLLRRGRIYVLPEESVAPGDAVRVRAAGTGTIGAFRKTSDTGNTLDCSKFAQWVTSGSSTVPAVLEIDLVGMGMATAD